MGDVEKRWTAIASKQFLGRKIVAVRYLSEKEVEEIGWSCQSIVLQLDDGNLIYPSCDDEGNNGGALFTTDANDPVIPVIYPGYVVTSEY
jgi:hypothetical protein